jgi:trigger factor
MKVTQEKLPASQIGLEIEIAPEMSKKAYDKVIQKIAHDANIPGFRKGKVPRQVLVQRFGAVQLKATALEELIETSLKQAIEQENIPAIGNFELRVSFDELVSQFQPGTVFTFSAAVDVQPEVRLTQYKDLHVQAEEVTPDPARVDKMLQDYREQTATLIPVEGRAAQLKDVVVVDYKSVLVNDDPDAKPEPFPGGEADNFQLELEEDKFIAGFVDGIVGMTVGETKELSVQFPADYPQENLAGQKAVFTITMKEIKEKELPELDDEFAGNVSEFKTLAELREALTARHVKEAETQTRLNKEQAISDQLINCIEVDLPETLIDQELTYMVNQTAAQLQNQGIDVRKLFNQETIAAMKAGSRPDAIQRLKRTLALAEVAKQEAIEVTEKEVTDKVNQLLLEIEDRQTIDHDHLQRVVSDDLLKEKIVDWLIENSSIELVPEGTLHQDDASKAEVMEATTTDVPEGDRTSEVEVIEVSATTVPDTDQEDVSETEIIEASATAVPNTEQEDVSETEGLEASAIAVPDADQEDVSETEIIEASAIAVPDAGAKTEDDTSASA